MWLPDWFEFLMMTIRWTMMTALVGSVFSLGSLRAEEPIQPADPKLQQPVDFFRDVAPILKAKCQACHSDANQESELALENAAQIVKGGARGPAVVPGKPDESLLYLVAARREEPLMPPLPNVSQAEPLTPRELGVFRLWIEAGAPAGRPVNTMPLQWRAIPDSQQAIHSIAVTPDQQSALAGRGNRVVVYDLLAKQQVAHLSDPHLMELQQNGSPFYASAVAHRDLVHALALSPDGRRLASGGYRTIKIWDEQPARRVVSIPGPVGDKTIVCVNQEGTHVAFVDQKNALQICNLADGKQVAALPLEKRDVNALVFSPDGKSLAVGLASGQVDIVDVGQRQFADGLITPSPVVAMTFVKHSSRLTTAHVDHQIRIWEWPLKEADLGMPNSPLHTLTGHSAAIAVLCSRPGTPEVISAAADGNVRVWNVESGKFVREMPFDAPVTALVVSADGNLVIAAGGNQRVRAWDQEGKQVWEVRGASFDQLQLAKLKDDQQVAAAQQKLAQTELEVTAKNVEERKATLMKAEEAAGKAERELAEQQKKLDPLQEKLKNLEEQVQKTPDDKKLAKAVASQKELVQKQQTAITTAQQSLDKARKEVTLTQPAVPAAEAVHTQSEAELAAITRLLEETQARVSEFAKQLQNPTGDTVTLLVDDTQGKVLAVDGEQRLSAWTLSQGRPLIAPRLEGKTRRIVASVPQRRLLIIDQQHTLAVCDTSPQWKLTATLGPPPGEPLNLGNSVIQDRVATLDFHPDGTRLASGGGAPSRTGELLLWDLATGEVSQTFPDVHADTVQDLEFSRDGSLLVTGAADKVVRTFDVERGEMIHSFEGHTDHVLGVAINGDQSLIASGGADQVIKVWNTETGEQKQTIAGFDKQVTSVAFVGISGQVLAGSGDRQVKLLDATNGKVGRAFGGATDYIYCAQATSDGKRILAGGEAGVLRVWDGENGNSITTFGPTTGDAQQVSSAP